MSTLDLDSTRSKLARAKEHIDSLNRELRDWADGSFHTIVIKPESDRKRWVIKIIMATPPDTRRFANILGDAAHNLRSAIDHFFYAVAQKYAPNADPRRKFFPVVEQQHRFHGTKQKPGFKMAREGFGLPECVWTAIEAEQPYMRSDGGALCPLLLLHNLDIDDKHRAGAILLTVHEPSGNAKIQIPGLSTVEASIFPAFNIGPSCEAEIGWLTFQKPPDVDPEFDSALTVDFVLRIEDGTYRSVIQFLEYLSAEVVAVIDRVSAAVT